MPSSSELDAFFVALEKERGDAVTLNALGDWYEEQGDAVAGSCFHAVARLAIRPGFSKGQTMFGKFYWVLDAPDPIITDPPAHLPKALWDALREYDEKYSVASFKSYQTARAAYEDLLRGWAEVGPIDLGEKREEPKPRKKK